MFTIPGYQVTEEIHRGAKTTVYRGYRVNDGCPVAFKTTSAEYPAMKDLARLQHEYALTKDWNEEGLIRSYALLPYQNTQVLILQCIGGLTLRQLMAQKLLSIDDFLKLALAFANSLNRIHQHHIIHKDINPSNLVVNLETGQTQIIDFGISSQLSREMPELQNPGHLEGTLAYLSPEQTGRMNRSLDYRTDFYSLGATFYEMLTGEQPFAATDPMELVHCHLAKMPRPPHELRPELPPILSLLVLKLMGKTAEARYQSAFGLCADLENCRKQFSAIWPESIARNPARMIESFPLGRHDVSERFQIPQNLYGRETEVQQVLDAFARVGLGQTEMLLVAGYSGVGKTALVHELHKPITKKNGYFINGKFDQFQRDIPYTSLIQAFQELVRQLLTESPIRILHWKNRLSETLGVNAQLMIEVIPEIALILGPQAAVPALPPQEARNRFQATFRQLIEVFAQPGHPLVLFLDDLQWADFASLQFLEELLLKSRHQSLLILGAYRDNEVNAAHPFMLALDTLRKAEVSVTTLHLQPLCFGDLARLVADTLTPCQADPGPLAELIFHKTGGNPFFVNAFLTRLYEAGWLTFSPIEGGWKWEIACIEAQQITDNVIELMSQKLRTLPLATQHLLVLAACIGHHFDLATLSLVSGKNAGAQNAPEVMQNLWDAVKAGMVQQQGTFQIAEILMASSMASNETEPIAAYRFRFIHDRVQQAAYELLPSAETAALHLKIGRLWLKQLDHSGSNQADEALFAVANQFHAAIDLIHEKAERVLLAQLHLQAGKKAIASAAFSSALGYLTTGLTLLNGGDWENQYQLTLALSLGQAECEFINHQHELAEQHFKICLQHAKTDLEKAGIHLRQMTLSGSRGDYQRAVDDGLAGLRLLGVRLPRHPRKYHIMFDLWQENWHRRGGEVRLALDRLQLATHPEHQLAIQLLSATSPFASFVDLPLTALIGVKAVNLIYRRGITTDAAYILMTFSATLVAMRRYQLAWDYAEKSKELCQTQNANTQLMSLHMFANWLNHWYHPLHTSIPILQHCLKLALESGNWIYASFSMCNHLHALCSIGFELPELTRQSQEFSLLYKQMNDPNRMASFCTFCIAWSQALNGHNAEGHPFNNLASISEETTKNTPNGAVQYFINILSSFHELIFENHHQAVIYLKKAKKTLFEVIGMQISTDYFFLNILITLAQQGFENNTEVQPQPQSPTQPKPVTKTIQSSLRKLAGWAKQSPENFAHKYLLAAAEVARVEGHRSQAEDLYDEAIEAAQKNGFIHHQALACECAARFYLQQGKIKFANIYLTEAHFLYTKWGALAKIKQLEEKHPHLVIKTKKNPSATANRTLSTQTSTISDNTGVLVMESETLDLATVMKATQAISGEIILENLLKKLMRIVIENAGAQHGFLLLETDGEWRIEAEGNVHEQAVSVLQSKPLIPDHSRAEAENASLPISLIHYVALTKEALLLDNAAAKGRFVNDPYITRTQMKSVLCAPILHQGKLAGILYLENNLTDGAFTADRLEVLRILSSQAAISIENALVYEHLESTVAQRTGALSQSNAALSESNSALSIAYSAAETAREQAESAKYQATEALNDLRAAQNQMVQSAKMASLGHLVAGVAHELNTPIGNALTSSSVLTIASRDFEAALMKGAVNKSTLIEFIESTVSMADVIDRSCQRAATLINSFKQVAADQTSEQRRTFALHSLVKDNIAALSAGVNQASWVIETEIHPGIHCDTYPGPLGQVIANLVQNAVLHAFHGRTAGTLKITATTTTETVEMIFQDDGNGMDSTVLKHIFEPFYTTRLGHDKERGGPGLGLSISLNIVTSVLGGTLSASSVLGHGSTFVLNIPLKASNSQSKHL